MALGLYNRIDKYLRKCVNGEFMQASFFPTDLQPIAEKVLRQERLSFEEGLQLFESDDLVSIGAMANLMRERINGDFTYYNVNRHMNYTNVCVSDCAFCGFYRRVRHPEAYEWSVQ
jgi:aminodeoxyfutalosine synthase